MENQESNAQAVWQRVFAQPVQPDSDLRQLQLTAAEMAGIYRHLIGMHTGKQRERLRWLYEEELSNVACLKGLGILMGKPEEVLKLWTPSREPGRRLLEKCYHLTRRMMVDCMGRSAEPEYGIVFRTLADREAAHCAAIAELLGRKI